MASGGGGTTGKWLYDKSNSSITGGLIVQGVNGTGGVGAGYSIQSLNGPNYFAGTTYQEGGLITGAQVNVGTYISLPAPTNISGSAGHIFWSQPIQGTGGSKLIVVLDSYTSASPTVITYPATFVYLSSVVGNSSTIVTSTITTTVTAVTIPACTLQTGTIVIEGI